MLLIIPVTRRVKGYIRFVRKNVTCKRNRFRPYKVHIFMSKITSQVDIVCSYVLMNAEISETIEATTLKLDTLISARIPNYTYRFT